MVLGLNDWHHRVLVPLLLVVLLALAACGAAAPPTPAVVERQVLVTPTPGPKETIVFSDLNWPSAQLQNRIATYIVERGYGYPATRVSGDTLALFAALVNGETHVTMEVWLPNQRQAFDKALAEGSVIPVGRSLDDSWQSTFVVPQYVLDENPGLRSVRDLRRFKDLFVTPDSDGKARLITCVVGWECNGVNKQKIEAYGLSDVVELVPPDSSEALFASLRSSYAKGDPWLGYMWGPTKVASELDLALLAELPCTPEQQPKDGCAYPTSRVMVAVHPSLISRAPEIVEFLRRWDFDAASQLATEDWMTENQATVGQGATWFLENRREWTAWVPPDVERRVKEALANEQ